MAIQKYYKLYLFNLVFCLSSLVIISCAEIKALRKDKHLSEWDDLLNKFKITRDPYIDDLWNRLRKTETPYNDDWWNKFQRTQEPDPDDWWNKLQITRDPYIDDLWNKLKKTQTPYKDDWWNKFLTTQEPDDWWNKLKITRDPYIDDLWNKLRTIEDPFKDDWLNKYRTTKDPLDLNWNRWDWDRFDRITFSPPIDDRFDYVFKKSNDKTGIYFAVFLIVFVLMSALVAYLKYYCEENSRDSRIYGRLAAAESGTSTPSTQRTSVPTISRNTTPRPHFILEFSNPVTNDQPSVTDQPPRYDEVVIGDLSGEGKFPEVTTSIPDTPPPQYEDDNSPRY